MNNFTIGNKNIAFDSSKEYLDFYLTGTKQNLAKIDLEAMLNTIQAGKIPLDNYLKDYMTYLKRWTVEAPRKRNYRKMRKEGFTVLSTEQFFDGEDGEEIINKLENTGKFAEYFLKEVYNK